MKIMFLVILIFAGQELFAQSTTVKNNGATTTGYLPKFLYADTVGNSILYQSGNNIGIGTTSPAANIHLWGNGDQDLIIEADADNSGEEDNSRLILRQDGNLVNSIFGTMGATAQYSGAISNSAFIESKDASGASAIQFVTGGTTIGGTNGFARMTILPSGKIGIGTSSPDRTLSLYSEGTGSATSQLRFGTFSNTSADQNILLFSKAAGTIGTPTQISSGAHLGTIQSQGYKTTTGFTNGASISFQASGTPSTYTPTDITIMAPTSTTNDTAIFIKSGGSVGIGTSNPIGKLHVSGPLTVGSAIGPSGSYNLTVAGADAGIFLQRSGGGSNEPFVLVYTPTANSGGQFRGLDAGGIRFTDGSSSAEWMRITYSGNIGIGSTNPSSKLEVKDAVYPSIGLTNGTYSGELSVATGSGMYSNIATTGDFVLRSGSSNSDVIISARNSSGGIKFGTGSGDTEKMSIQSNGTVLINKTSASNSWAKLDVAGGIRADSIFVNTSGADFVFDESYSLRSLKEVEQFIQKNKHLPEIPTAKEMQKEGVSVGVLQTKLLQKIEELTLYVIKLDKQNSALKQELEKMKQ